ncbi:MAG: DUF4197 domain-containing protein [Pseudomonadota bacterium]
MTKQAVLLSAIALMATGATHAFSLNDLKDAAKAAIEDKTGSLSNQDVAGALSNEDITQGLKEALTNGANTVVSQLGAAKGFSGDPAVRIPLPKNLAKARKLAKKVGLEGYFDDLELKLNEAAEAATPKARALFVDAITGMSVSDAKGILQGPDDAATSYFRNKTGADLQSQMRPIVDEALASVGAVTSFNTMMERYNAIPFAPKVDSDLTGHVVEKGADGIFHYLAVEEKAIRDNPVKRTSELLKRVFGQ